MACVFQSIYHATPFIFIEVLDFIVGVNNRFFLFSFYRHIVNRNNNQINITFLLDTISNSRNIILIIDYLHFRSILYSLPLLFFRFLTIFSLFFTTLY